MLQLVIVVHSPTDFLKLVDPMTRSAHPIPPVLRRLFTLLAITLPPALPATAATQAPARVRITVSTSPGAGPPASPYVALVAETSPWSRPIEETVLTGSREVSWQAPAGSYRIVAGAPGFSLEYGPAFDLEPGAPREETVKLTALQPVEGRVVAAGGADKPIAGAIVSPLRNLVLGSPGRLSDLGERHLAGNFEAATDAYGRFRLLLRPRAGYVIAVRAEGWTPRFFPHVRLPDSAKALEGIELAPGASLAVDWRVAAASGGASVPAAGGNPGGYDRLQLVPADGTYPEGLDLGAVLAVWARPVQGARGSGTATWPSLPAGTYEVWAKAPPVGAHSLVPRRLAEVELEPGAAEKRTVEVPSAQLQVAGAAGTAGGKELEALLPAMPRSELESLRVHEWPSAARAGSDGESERYVRFRAHAVSGGILLRFPGACRAGTELTLATDKRVGALGPLDLSRPDACSGSPAGRRRLALYPRADLELAVRAERGSSLPPGGELEVRPCAQVRADPGAPRLAMGVPVALPEAGGDQKPAAGPGKIETPVPAGCLDLTLRVGEFAPLTWPGLNLEAGKPRDLGSFQLRLGAALLVRVLAAQDGRPLPGVKVSAVPTKAVEEVAQAAGAELSGLPAGAARAHAALEGPATGRDGWVRLYGLPTGNRLTVLLLGPGRHLPALSREVQLAPGEERVLDDLELGPPAALTVQVELSNELEADGAEPYRVYLDRIDPRTPRLSLSEHVPRDGRVRFEEVLPGTWRVMALVRIAAGRPFPGGEDEVALTPGADSTARLELGNRVFRGQVTFEGLPVEGFMGLEPLSPPDRNGMTVRLDEKGKFRVPLEGPGTYSVRVTDTREDQFPDAVLPEVRFEDPDEPVEIHLPEGRIAGVVVDEKGRPVPGARVKSLSDLPVEQGERYHEARRLDRSGSDGQFAVRALAPGSWTLVAEAESGESLPRTFELGHDQDVDGVRLVVETRTEVHGKVVDALGRPVAGARLAITPQAEAVGEVPELTRTTTDGLGRFSVATALVGRTANFQVVEPGGSATAVRAELAKGILLELPPAGAPVVVSLPCSKRSPAVSGVYFFVSQDGAFLPFPSVGRVESESVSPCRYVRTVRGLGVGLWHVVRMDTAGDESVLANGAGGFLRSRAEVRSAPGRVVRVRVDSEDSVESNRQ
jgi:hypothetical protein